MKLKQIQEKLLKKYIKYYLNGSVTKLNKPFLNLDHLIDNNKLKELNDKLVNDIEKQKLSSFKAKNQNYGFSIYLTKRRYKSDNEIHCEERGKRGKSYYHIPNKNFKKFRYLIKFVNNLDLFEDIGSIVIIINKKNEIGIEHYDHDCKNWDHRPAGK